MAGVMLHRVIFNLSGTSYSKFLEQSCRNLPYDNFQDFDRKIFRDFNRRKIRRITNYSMAGGTSGERLVGVASEAAAKKLRGRVGTTVTVKLNSVNDTGSTCVKEIKLPREVIKLSPVSSAMLSHITPDGHLSKTGYVKLSTFSQTAAAEMEDTVHEMENQGVQSYILDLRNNPGGLVKVGLDVALIWLDGMGTLVNTIDRDGNMLPINMINGHSLTRDPLVVLVKRVQVQVRFLQGPFMTMAEHFLLGIEHLAKEKFRV